MRYKYYQDKKGKVIAVSSYAGKPLKGVAKCDPRDKFDLEKGKELAKARCDVKVAQKRLARATEVYDSAFNAFCSAVTEFHNMKRYFQDSQKAVTDAKKVLNEVLESIIDK